ncbi:MAG: hypothetical protein IT435_04130 [Phycisphaerales bacterium]|nr:hypothetical protein [Phycisphaerales bacterium]
MTGEHQQPNPFDQLRRLRIANTFAVPSAEATQGDSRLTADFYSESGYRARKALIRSGFQLRSLREVAATSQPSIFKRCYVDDETHGVPYLTGAALVEARPPKIAFLSRSRTSTLHELYAEPGVVLITDSGTIGRVVFATEDLKGWATTNNAIRLRQTPDGWPIEYLYVCLQSELGQYLLTRSTYGSVVDHIEPNHVDAIELPLLPRLLVAELCELVRQCNSLRVRANALLSEVHAEVQRSCYLPDLSALRPRNRLSKEPGPELFWVRSGERFPDDAAFGEYRLDASYHLPVAVSLAKYILGHEGGSRLEDVVKGVRNSALRKRVYVDDPALGVPMLGGKQLMQSRPHDVKLLSRVLTRNVSQETVQEGWTLVSSGGTLARTLFVHRNLEGSTVSQDVMRVIPDAQKAFPGFIYAFLASPYGQVQLHQRGYGSVIPRLRDLQFNSIAIRVPKDKGEAIHQKVVQAFDARADAKAKEDSAIKVFMSALANGRAYVESEWGKEY